MYDLLSELENRQEDESACELLFELENAFDAFMLEKGKTLPEDILRLYHSLKLVVDDDFGRLLENHRDVVIGAHDFAVQHELEEVAQILSDALEGKPQEDVLVDMTVGGKSSVTVKIDTTGKMFYVSSEDTVETLKDSEQMLREELFFESEKEQKDANDLYWGGTDILLSMSLEPFEEALLDEMIAAKAEFRR